LIGSIAVIWSQANTTDNATSISINNKYWFVGGIQYYGVGCFFPDTVNGKKLLTKDISVIGKQLIEVIVVLLTELVG